MLYLPPKKVIDGGSLKNKIKILFFKHMNQARKKNILQQLKILKLIHVSNFLTKLIHTKCYTKLAPWR